MENVGKKKLDMQKLLAPAALVILYIVFSIFGNNFLTLDTVKNILESSYYIGSERRTQEYTPQYAG